MINYLDSVLANSRELELLAQSSSMHSHLCPRQVLGVRMGLYAGQLLRLELPQTNKRLLALVETDGCFADGVSVATGCWFGRRTLRLLDYGRVAATFVDGKIGRAIRIAPQTDLRTRVREARKPGQRRWDGYLEAYQRLEYKDLYSLEEVVLPFSLKTLVGAASQRVVCSRCGEEVLNGREVILNGLPTCRACARLAPYQPLAPDRPDNPFDLEGVFNSTPAENK